MAVADKSGRMHHSASRAKFHDDMAGDKPAKPKGEPDKPKPQSDGGDAQTQSSSEPIEDVVSAHGPANEVEYKHDKTTGKHHVKSKHGDENKEHVSEHESEQEAHKHIGKAMGGTPADDPDEELGEEAGEVLPQMEDDEPQHSRIPGMR